VFDNAEMEQTKESALAIHEHGKQKNPKAWRPGSTTVMHDKKKPLHLTCSVLDDWR